MDSGGPCRPPADGGAPMFCLTPNFVIYRAAAAAAAMCTSLSYFLY